jgi:hypothetical protein
VLDKFPLVAIPFFILAGNLMDTGGISRRLIDVARAIVGSTQGGLAATCVVACMIFAAVSGSSTATTFAIGAIMIPALVRAGYPKPWAAGLQATSAELGVIIPPSIPLILFGVAADVSIGELFIAGFGPGLLIGFVLIAYVLVWAQLIGHGREDMLDGVAPWPAIRRAMVECAAAMGAPTPSGPIHSALGVFSGLGGAGVGVLPEAPRGGRARRRCLHPRPHHPGDQQGLRRFRRRRHGRGREPPAAGDRLRCAGCGLAWSAAGKGRSSAPCIAWPLGSTTGGNWSPAASPATRTGAGGRRQRGMWRRNEPMPMRSGWRGARRRERMASTRSRSSR